MRPVTHGMRDFTIASLITGCRNHKIYLIWVGNLKQTPMRNLCLSIAIILFTLFGCFESSRQKEAQNTLSETDKLSISDL